MEIIDAVVNFFSGLYNYNPVLFVIGSVALIFLPYLLKKGDA